MLGGHYTCGGTTPDAPVTHATPTTRLAPSPTGDLHLGHARTFLLTAALARSQGWRILLRLEDLDRQRVVDGASERTVEMLSWLGIEWDEPPTRQRDDLRPFEDAMRRLADAGSIFACTLSRREIREAASAPHGHEGEPRFDPRLRPPPGDAWRFARADQSHRLRVEPGEVAFVDQLLGPRRFDPSAECGDFAVWTREGVPSYQLAVVVDDARQGVTDVVRGDDLLASTARQILLQRAIGLPHPRWWHLPLVADAEGSRLAKRHGATSLESLRGEGATAERISGLIAWWCRWTSLPAPLDPRALREMVTPESLRALAEREQDPAARPRVDEEALRWLRDA